MLNNPKVKPGLEAPDSPDTETPEKPETDVSTIIAALKKTEQCILAKIDTSLAAVAGELHKKMDDLSSGLRAEITGVHTELSKAIKEIQKENAACAAWIENLEEGANGYSDRVVELQNKVSSLTLEVTRLISKTEDLECRQRRENCRLIGVEEGFGNMRPKEAVAKLLQDSLGLSYTPTLDRPHRSLQPRPKDVNCPRLIVIKFHYFQEKVDVLRKAMSAGPIFHNGRRLHIYLDYAASVSKRRATFTKVQEILRRCPGVKYGILYPATLKITTPAGEQQSFEDLTKAKQYIEANLQPDRQDESNG